MVFRSGRSGDKNLYIMSTEGEERSLLRLTEGPWDDTMPGWTPASGWIVFASSRNYVDSNRPAGAFDIFMVSQPACMDYPCLIQSSHSRCMFCNQSLMTMTAALLPAGIAQCAHLYCAPVLALGQGRLAQLSSLEGLYHPRPGMKGDLCCLRRVLTTQVRPDGSGLRRVFDSHGGLANHPKFSPKFTPEAGRIVFTSDFAGYSAEEIALPHQFQPYGDLFSIKIDGTNLQRLTHGELPLIWLTSLGHIMRGITLHCKCGWSIAAAVKPRVLVPSYQKSA